MPSFCYLRTSITNKFIDNLLSVSSKFSDFLLLTDVCQQQIYRLLATDRHLSIASSYFLPILLPRCRRTIPKTGKSVKALLKLSDRETIILFTVYINASKNKKITSYIILTHGKILNIVRFPFAIHGVDNVYCLFV